MGNLYNNKNIGTAFVVLGSVLLLAIAGEFLIKSLFIVLALVCVDYGLRMMGNESLLQMIKKWLNS
ncbi:MAG: xanthine/uracil permease [Alteromonas naphthalenivorans]